MRKLNLNWLSDTRTGLSIFVCFIFCVGIGLGLFLGIDSQEAKVRHVEAEKEVLTRSLTEVIFYIELLDLKVKSLNRLLRKFIEDDEKSKDYNDTAVE